MTNALLCLSRPVPSCADAMTNALTAKRTFDPFQPFWCALLRHAWGLHTCTFTAYVRVL